MVFARSAAMAFNRYLDRRFDALNPRTASREIPAGIVSPNNALAFTIISSLLFIGTTWLINQTTFILSFIALFVTLSYSYTKRFTALCHIVLGIGLSLSPIGAYLAVANRFAWLPVFFSMIVLTWVAGFDIIYALQDEGFDKQHRLHSIPAALGTVKALRVSSFLHLLTAALTVWAGAYGNLGLTYLVGALLFNLLLVYQHRIVKPEDLSRVNIAFGNTNGIASIIFATFTILSFILNAST